jgi:glutathione peroxidase
MKKMNKNIYEFQVTTIDGKSESLEKYKGKILLIVNVASKCGFTNQYKELEELYKKYQKQNIEILAFPCNQFGAQEPGDEAEIKKFCELNYNVSFPMFSKIEVNGKNTHPLYQFLKEAAPGLLGSKSIKWNFTKFLVDQNGYPLKRYAPNDKPEEIFVEIFKLENDT